LPSPRPALSPADLYQRLLPAVVSVEKLDGQHRRIGLGSGFILEGDLIVTTFENIERASLVRVTTDGGATVDLNGALAWSRREGWAVLRLPVSLDNALVGANPGSWQVGDICYSLDSPQEGSRTIVSGHVTGSHKFPDLGEKLKLHFRLSPRAEGSPVVTEYGEVIGIASPSGLLPGLSSLASTDGEPAAYPGNLVVRGLVSRIAEELALPITLLRVPRPSASATSFTDMAKTSQFLESLARNENLFTGTMGRSVKYTNQQLLVNDEKFEYQRRDGHVTVLVTWHAHGKFKSAPLLRIYDVDNKMVAMSPRNKVNLSNGDLAFSCWAIKVDNLSPGTYRVDLVMDGPPVWRTFFRLTE
jgi:hypothetical protein